MFIYLNIKKLVVFILISVAGLSVAKSQENWFASLREQMVRTQIEARGINDQQVLKAFLNVERHKFVPLEYISAAYQDSPLPIGYGQTISQPYIVAFMTQALDLQPDDKVLEIGTGSGYQAAILAEICDSVFTVEISEPLAKRADQLFNELGYDNIYNKTGDGYKGWPENAPYDAIIVTASPSHIPEPLKRQLAEGGRMIIPVGRDPIQELILLHKKNGNIVQDALLNVRFVPLINQEGKKH